MFVGFETQGDPLPSVLDLINDMLQVFLNGFKYNPFNNYNEPFILWIYIY